METETVSAATEEQGAAIEEVSTASRQLADMATKLQQAVAEFKLR
jgi:methyl-accepting chemotaxis protein